MFKGTCIGFLVNNFPEENDECLMLTIENVDDLNNSEININKNLEPIQQQQIEKLIKEYDDIFAKNNAEMGRTNMVKHEINVQGAQPIKCKPYRVSQKEREIIDNQLEEMLQNGIIRKSQSPWASPVVLVKKKDGSHRFCVDYRKLNAVTKKSSYPLPNIDDVLSYLGGAKYYTSLDLFSGYWQVEISEESKELTALRLTAKY